jgi:hypothetical protein
MTTEQPAPSTGTPSGTGTAELHLSRDHYRPILQGNALAFLGRNEHLRLVTIMIGAMRDECTDCVSDTADAIALDAAATAVVHRFGASLSGSTFVPLGSEEAEKMLIELNALPFLVRRQMVMIGAVRLKEFLDGQTPPQALI